MNNEGLILLAHGSRNPKWKQPFEQLITDMKQEDPDRCVHLAFLQFQSPDLKKTVQEMVAQGVGRIRILPMLMATGNHALEDIPEETEAVQQCIPEVQLEILPPIGSHPEFKSMLKNLIRQLL